MTLALKKKAIKEKEAVPFLKWAGGKRRLFPEIIECFPEHFNRYHEPFLGGGAVFFGIAPQKSTLSDDNNDLINTWKVIRDNVDKVVKTLQKHRSEEEYYYQVRQQKVDNLSDIAAAARIIFLNRTCFNGLYRVNRRGEFNVPFGRYTNPTICNAANLYRVSNILQNVNLRCESVFNIGRRVRFGDLVYFDPPYDPVSKTSSFRSYTKNGFGDEEQIKLAKLFERLANRGVHVVLSNSDTPFIRELYKDFKIKRVYARRAINSRADRRGPVSEVIVTGV